MHNTVHCRRLVVCIVHAHCACSRACCGVVCAMGLHAGYSVTLHYHVLSLGACSVVTQPSQPTLSDTKTRSRHQTSLSCRDKGNPVAIGFSLTLKRRCRDTYESCHDTISSHDAAPLSRHQNYVATPKIPSYPKPCCDTKAPIVT